MSRRLTLVVAITILALVAGGAAWAHHAAPKHTTKPPKPSAQQYLRDHPAPTLYTDQEIASLQTDIAPARQAGVAAADAWLATHHGRDDAAFIDQAMRVMPRPTTGVVQARELRELHHIRAHHSAAGDAASKWLESEGKKRVWKVFLHQHDKLVQSTADVKANKQLLSSSFSLADKVLGRARPQFQRRPPYQIDPTLQGLNSKKFATARKFSFPSKHSVRAAAAAGVLDALEPHRAGQFDWMEAEVDYARLYGAGHFRSDITAGAFLGAMIAEYELSFADAHAGRLW